MLSLSDAEPKHKMKKADPSMLLGQVVVRLLFLVLGFGFAARSTDAAGRATGSNRGTQSQKWLEQSGGGINGATSGAEERSPAPAALFATKRYNSRRASAASSSPSSGALTTPANGRARPREDAQHAPAAPAKTNKAADDCSKEQAEEKTSLPPQVASFVSPYLTAREHALLTATTKLATNDPLASKLRKMRSFLDLDDPIGAAEFRLMEKDLFKVAHLVDLYVKQANPDRLSDQARGEALMQIFQGLVPRYIVDEESGGFVAASKSLGREARGGIVEKGQK
eukprot:g6977.t1